MKKKRIIITHSISSDCDRGGFRKVFVCRKESTCSYLEIVPSSYGVAFQWLLSSVISYTNHQVRVFICGIKSFFFV